MKRSFPTLVGAGAVGLLLAGAVLHSGALRLAGPAGETDVDAGTLRPSLTSSTGSCGVERWSVKTGTDASAGSVDLSSTTTTTVSAMRGYPAPASLPSSGRLSPQETTVYSIDATLIEYKLETDSDYHLVIQDASGTMIVEIPDPGCVGGSSPFLAGIQNARSEFDASYTPGGSFHFVSVPVRVKGVGFFDYLHGQTGVAPNGIELHPVLDVQFNPGPPPPPPPPPCSTPTGPAPVLSPSNYVPLTPARIYDSRGTTALGPCETRTIPIAGQFGVPSGAQAIVLNVGVTDTRGSPSGYVLVYPAGETMPVASTDNFVAGQTIANLTQVPLGAGGAISIYNSAGYADVFLDIQGYYGAPATTYAGLYNSLSSPVRFLDTRTGVGGHLGQLGPGGVLRLLVAGSNGVPADAQAVVFNLTEVNGTAGSYLAAWPDGQAWPGISNLNFPGGRVQANRAIVTVGSSGFIDITNSQGNVDVLVDVAGWFSGGASGDQTGLRFTPVSPTRIFDTRSGIGGHPGPIGSGQTATVTPTSPGTALSMNAAVLNASTNSYLGVYPTAAAAGQTSDINFQPGDILPNLVITGTSAGNFVVYNSVGTVDVFIDENGTYS